MEKSGKRGKIPQTDWPLIMSRYEAGETLSSIARTYDCSPPAISYIVSRSREKSTNEAAAASASEPQLIKAPANGASTNGSAAVEPTAAPLVAIRRDPVPIPETRPATPVNGAAQGVDQRRKLHLSLGNGGANGNGGGAHVPGNAAPPVNGNGHSHEPPARPSLQAPQPQNGQSSGAQPQGADERNGQRAFQAPRSPPPFDGGRNGRDLFSIPEGRPAAQQPRDAESARKDNSAFIDQELRSRVDGDIAAFLTAFDAALAADTPESRFGLREATDRLLRAGARTRIELERLEARVPLPPRERSASPDPGAWRQR